MPNEPVTVILTHEHADFDALASLLGASLIFPDTLPVLPRRINRNGQAFLALYRTQFPFIEANEMPRAVVEQVILVDTRSFNAVKGMDEETKYLVIDHHTIDEPLPDKWRIWEEGLGPHTVGANTTLLVEKLMVQDVQLTSLQATLLALGIYEDTGSLIYKSTTHRDARCVAWLLEQGANLEVINRFIHYPLSEKQHQLYQKLSEQSEYLEVAGQTVLIAQAEAEDFEDELSALAHKLRQTFEPDAIFLIIDLGDRVQVVARSSTDAVDVGQVAEALGGGGHTRAAAALIRDGDAQAVRQQVMRLARVHSHPPVTVRQIMSRGRPHTLSPQTTLEKAVELMRRYGHEGFPVLARQPDGGEKLVGILTRREADRAFDHGLGKQPVQKFMRTGVVTVTPDTPIPELHKRMIDSGWGQIPVVNSQDQIIGIVTRTDLIKLWSEQGEAQVEVENLSEELARALNSLQHQLLRMAGEEVVQMSQSVYVVGGFVRDLLLERVHGNIAPPDMDLVVEGDAIALARRLQDRCGGRVVTHRRFGTAKWLLDEPEYPIQCSELRRRLQKVAPNGVPNHLDLVTARTEFYTEPTVLPTVEQGSIKLDLHRRDFTINTLAISLTPDRWGELLDFYGGLADIRRRLVRVLHSLSFVDDPTRILRAVRYEQRFDFQIEERTLELLQDAVELIDRVTPARIRHELERILQEEEPEKVLQRLDELGVLQGVHPLLRADRWIVQRFAALRRRLRQEDPLTAGLDDPIERLYWGLLVYSVPAQADDSLSKRLKLRGETQRLMEKIRQVQVHVPRLLDPRLSPSEITEILDEGTVAALFVLSVAEPDSLLQERLRRYRQEWEDVRPTLKGEDLRKLGIKPGPIYGRILRRLRAAWLDGEIQSQEEELAMVAAIAQEEGIVVQL